MKFKALTLFEISIFSIVLYLGLFVNEALSSNQLKIGDRIKVTASSLNVREKPGVTSKVLGSQKLESQGIIVGGLNTVDKTSWWQIKYDSGVVGWSSEKYILLILPSKTPVTNNMVINKHLLWGAYIGGSASSIKDFENLVGKKMNYYAEFKSWDNNFPLDLSTTVGKQGKTLIIFWEPNFGYDDILNNSKDDYIKNFAADAKTYNYPIILVPFVEMNLNEEAWGYGQNNNTPDKFKYAWKHIHNLFAEAKNVRFGLVYNNISIPNLPDNNFIDYYPGDSYVDYVGVDGFNFSDPGNTFAQTFDTPMKQLASFNKPIIIFSTASVSGPNRAKWITEGLGIHAKTYKNLLGWIWFNQGGLPNWLINSDSGSLQAFKSVLPQ